MTRLAVSFALLAACSSSKPSEPTTPNGSGSATPTANAAPAVVTDDTGAKANAGAVVDVKGTARDAKLGAVVVASSLVVYCLGVEHWPDDVFGKPVTAHGKLEQTTEFAAQDETSAGTTGPVWVLRDCKYGP